MGNWNKIRQVNESRTEFNDVEKGLIEIVHSKNELIDNIRTDELLKIEYRTHKNFTDCIIWFWDEVESKLDIDGEGRYFILGVSKRNPNDKYNETIGKMLAFTEAISN